MQRIYTPRLPPPTSQTKTHNYLQLRKEALGQPTLQKKTGSLPSGWDTEQCPARGQQRLAWARGGQRGQGGHGGAGPRHSPSTLTALEARLQVTAPSSRCRPFLPLEEPHPPAPPSTPARLVQHDPRGSPLPLPQARPPPRAPTLPRPGSWAPPVAPAAKWVTEMCLVAAFAK